MKHIDKSQNEGTINNNNDSDLGVGDGVGAAPPEHPQVLPIPIVDNSLLSDHREVAESAKFDPLDQLESPKDFKGPANDRQRAVVKAFKHAWKGYKEFAWGHDNLKPISMGSHDWFGLGLTIVDSLDTMFIMDLQEGEWFFL